MTQVNAITRLVADAKSYLWMHNTQTGLWDLQRDVSPETQDKWLEIFQKDQPHARFAISAKRPKPVPNQVGERSHK